MTCRLISLYYPRFKKKKGKRESRATPASVSVGRRSLTPHCLGGARSLLALCPRNVCSGRGGNRAALPEKARENPRFERVCKRTTVACGGRAVRKHARGMFTSSGKLHANFSWTVARSPLSDRARARFVSSGAFESLKVFGFQSFCRNPDGAEIPPQTCSCCRDKFPAAEGGLFRPIIHLGEVDISFRNSYISNRLQETTSPIKSP